MNAAHLEFCASREWRRIVEERILPDALGRASLGPRVIEIGPGPGFTTDVLAGLVEHLTAVELDRDLAGALRRRLSGSNVDVVLGDATALTMADGTFTGAASFHMLHHLPGVSDQDRALGELVRVLQPGGVLAAADGVENAGSRAFHEDDIYQPIDPDHLERRLIDVGFASADVGIHELGRYCTAVA